MRACSTDAESRGHGAFNAPKEIKMGILQRFLRGISLPLAVWLLACGAVRASEGAASAATPGVVETEWPGVTVELTSLEPVSDKTLLLRFQYELVASFRHRRTPAH
jgi:hypothetical protein